MVIYISFISPTISTYLHIRLLFCTLVGISLGAFMYQYMLGEEEIKTKESQYYGRFLFLLYRYYY